MAVLAQGAGVASGGAADSRARGAAAELDRRRQSRAGGVLPAVRARFPAARAARGPERRRAILRGLRAAPGRDARLPRFDHGCGRQRADDRRRRRRRGNPTGAEPRLLDLSVAARERGDSVRQRRAQGESREAGRQDALALRIAGRGAVPPGRGAARAGAAPPGFPGRRLLHPRLRLRDRGGDPSGRGRRSPRLSQHRRPRTCRCARLHAVARRAGVPDRSRDLRVSRWRRVARVLPRHRRAQHAAHRRRGSVAGRRRLHVGEAGAGAVRHLGELGRRRRVRGLARRVPAPFGPGPAPQADHPRQARAPRRDRGSTADVGRPRRRALPSLR